MVTSLPERTYTRSGEWLGRSRRRMPTTGSGIGCGSLHEELVELLHFKRMSALSKSDGLFERLKLIRYVNEMSLGDEHLGFDPSLLSQLPGISDAELNDDRAEKRRAPSSS